MKVRYTGESKTVKTVGGNDAQLESGMQLECLEKEYHSGSVIRAAFVSGERVKLSRKEVQKI